MSAAQINLVWTAATGTVDTYRVERSTTTSTGFTEVASLDSLTVAFVNNTGLSSATQYFYKVRACNTGGCSAYSPEVTATSAPGPPTSVTATTASSTQINLNWTATTGTVSSYRVERSTTSGSGFSEVDSVASSVTTFQNNTGLTPGTQYFYRMRACNVGGCSVYAAQVTATTRPAAPINPVATTVSATQINLSWTASAGTVDYRVERSTTSGSGFAEVATVATATLSNTGLTAATRYFYRVRACNVGGCSAFSTEVSALTLPLPPGAPSALGATTVSAAQINLSWGAATGTVDTYRVERSTTASSGFVEIASLANTATTFQNNTGLAPATQYFYRLRACNTGGCSVYTSEVTATTLPLPPGAPSGLNASAASSGQINLSWTAGTGTISTYRIERRTGAGAFAEVVSIAGTTTTHPDQGLSAGTQYDYQVRACNTGGCSAYTAPALATTLPNPPSGLGATTASAAQINLSWTGSAGAVATYRVERSTTAGAGFLEIASVTGATTTYQNNTGLNPATQYFYRVRACNSAGGCSAYTLEALATTFPLAPGTPTALGATTVSATQINLSWGAATGTVDTYRVERSTTAGSGFVEVASLANTATTFQNNTGLTPATQYFYRVRACNTGGCSSYTVPEATATTLPLAPGAPSGLAATTVSAAQINLAWTASSSGGPVANYRVERSTTAGGTFTEIGVSSTSTTFQNNTGLTPATQYFYRVRACNTGGCSGYTTEANATTQPLAPSGLTATTLSASQINLSWVGSSGTVDTYRVERSTTAGSGFLEIASVSGTTTTLQNNTGLTPATQYFYRVRTCNAGGCSPYTTEANATTLPLAPGAPPGFSATTISATQINLSWSAATGTVATYHVERSTTPGSGFLEIASLSGATTTFQNNTGLTPATQYFYRVRACNTGGCSTYSLEATATTLPLAPGAPSGLSATTVSASQINLAWAASSLGGPVTNYHVERSTTPGSGFLEIASVSSATTTFQNNTGLTPATQYFYRVRACNTGGCSTYTLEATATTLPLPPGAPSGLTATTVSAAQINLNWGAATGTVATYRVERSTTTGSGFVEIASLTNLTTAFQNNTGLTAATLYFYRVRACNTGGCSAYTTEASATTLPLAPGTPSGLTATTVSASQINLNWSAASGTVVNYRVERRTGAGAFAEIASLSSATLGFGDLLLNPATLYEYQVRACNTGGCSPFSALASATTLPLPPGAPSGLAATTISSAQINLTWSAATGTVATYHVERSTTTGSGFVEIGSVSAATTTFPNSGLTANTLYFYRVRACNTGGCSAYTLEATATTLPLPPGAPSGLTATTASASLINLSWSAATGIVATYHVERSTTAGSGFIEIGSVSAATTTFPNSGLTASTQYFYRVRACNTGGCSAYTLEAAATTLPLPPGAPSGLSATTAFSTQINLSWSAATGTVATYHVERSTTAGSGFIEIASLSSATTTFQNNTGLNPATQYFYRVRACNIGRLLCVHARGGSHHAAQSARCTVRPHRNDGDVWTDQFELERGHAAR